MDEMAPEITAMIHDWNTRPAWQSLYRNTQRSQWWSISLRNPPFHACFYRTCQRQITIHTVCGCRVLFPHMQRGRVVYTVLLLRYDLSLQSHFCIRAFKISKYTQDRSKRSSLKSTSVELTFVPHTWLFDIHVILKIFSDKARVSKTFPHENF